MNEVLFLGSGFYFFKMPGRLKRLREVEDGDYRPLLIKMSTFGIAGLSVIVDDPRFTSQACEILSSRRLGVVYSDRSFPYDNDSILTRYRIDI